MRVFSFAFIVLAGGLSLATFLTSTTLADAAPYDLSQTE